MQFSSMRTTDDLELLKMEQQYPARFHNYLRNLYLC